MPRIPSSALQRAIMRQYAKEAAERAIYMRRRRNEVLNRFRPTDEEIDEIIRIEDIERHNSRIPHYLPNDAHSGGYEQSLPYYHERDAAPRQRTLEHDFDRGYDPYGYEELL